MQVPPAEQVEPIEPMDDQHKWYVLASVAFGVFLSTLDGSMLNLAMPTLERVLHTDFATAQWVILAYLLTVTTLLLGIGRLADIIGKRNIYVSGFAVFTLGTLLCAFAPGIGWLIGFRVIQAIGAAMIFALGPAILTEAFPASQRGQVLGLVGLSVSAGIITGPIVGGLIIDRLAWPWIFLVKVPVCLLGIVLAWRYVQNVPPRSGQRFDYPGAALLFVALLTLLLALTLGQRSGFADPYILALFAGSLLFLVLFIIIEQRTSEPMIDLALFRNPTLTINVITGFVTFVLIAGVLYLVPFYLENVRGLPPAVNGQLLAILPISLGIMAPLSGWLSDRFSIRPITVIGLFVLLVGYFSLSRITADTSLLGLVLCLMPIGIGMGVFQSPNNSAIMGAVDPEQLGVTSSLLAITRTLGQTTGIAVLNAIWAGQVLALAPEAVARGGATAAPIAAQVTGLQNTLLVAVVLIALALGLSLWGWQQRH